MKWIIRLIILISFLVSCSSKGTLNLTDIQTSTTVNSINDLPKPTFSFEDIKKASAIIVLGESAPGQNQHNALTSARGVAQRDLLEKINGVKVSSETIVKKGILTKDEIRLLVSGHIKSLDCGAYYDRVQGIGYYCVQLPIK